ncbi:protein S100-A9-like [Sceloporus undulatus]|uniref:protein S100-A9-like n=1 Tax=Sceloporus undulatus TaxID=8520 RepID=UPI001C4D8CB9|nr:protein S100-A9-like [Sceloporus undulatus]
MKTDLEKALDCMVNIFHQYCILNPIDDYLQMKEFEKLLKEQAQPFLKNTLPPNVTENAYIKQLFQKADKNKDGKLKFTEFMVVVGAALIEAHKRSHDLSEGHGHGHGHSHSPDGGHGHGHSHSSDDGHGHGPGHGH